MDVVVIVFVALKLPFIFLFDIHNDFCSFSYWDLLLLFTWFVSSAALKWFKSIRRHFCIQGSWWRYKLTFCWFTDVNFHTLSYIVATHTIHACRKLDTISIFPITTNISVRHRTRIDLFISFHLCIPLVDLKIGTETSVYRCTEKYIWRGLDRDSTNVTVIAISFMLYINCIDNRLACFSDVLKIILLYFWIVLSFFCWALVQGGLFVCVLGCVCVCDCVYGSDLFGSQYTAYLNVFGCTLNDIHNSA